MAKVTVEDATPEGNGRWFYSDWVIVCTDTGHFEATDPDGDSITLGSLQAALEFVEDQARTYREKFSVTLMDQRGDLVEIGKVDLRTGRFKGTSDTVEKFFANVPGVPPLREAVERAREAFHDAVVALDQYSVRLPYAMYGDKLNAATAAQMEQTARDRIAKAERGETA